MRYIIRDREAGNEIEWCSSIEEAKNIIAKTLEAMRIPSIKSQPKLSTNNPVPAPAPTVPKKYPVIPVSPPAVPAAFLGAISTALIPINTNGP